MITISTILTYDDIQAILIKYQELSDYSIIKYKFLGAFTNSSSTVIEARAIPRGMIGQWRYYFTDHSILTADVDLQIMQSGSYGLLGNAICRFC